MALAGRLFLLMTLSMIDFLLIAALGFLGSFGHCVGMCGPLVTAFSLSPGSDPSATGARIRFQVLLNSGRLLSYALVGGGIGALGSVLLAGGQMAGIGSSFRQGVTILTGLLLIGLGLRQIAPTLSPQLPILHPLTRGKWHERLQRAMVGLAARPTPWTPLLLGMAWGLIPCGFLYTAQIRAAETGDFLGGMLTLVAFGLGTLPTMLGVGISTTLLSAHRRSQLFRAGGWITLIMGGILVLRTDAMVDVTGHGSLVCLGLALIARPLSRLWGGLLRYRRLLGVSAFLLATAHLGHMVDHSFDWELSSLEFLPLDYRLGIGAGLAALLLLAPAALTSFDRIRVQLGSRWRQIHLLTLPALGLAILHTIMTSSHYLGALQGSTSAVVASILLLTMASTVFLIRCRWVWSLVSLESWYVSPLSVSSTPRPVGPTDPDRQLTDQSSTRLRPHCQGR